MPVCTNFFDVSSNAYYFPKVFALLGRPISVSGAESSVPKFRGAFGCTQALEFVSVVHKHRKSFVSFPRPKLCMFFALMIIILSQKEPNIYIVTALSQSHSSWHFSWIIIAPNDPDLGRTSNGHISTPEIKGKKRLAYYCTGTKHLSLAWRFQALKMWLTPFLPHACLWIGKIR